MVCVFSSSSSPLVNDQADMAFYSDQRACYPLPCPSAPCSGSFSLSDFFKDSPWLNVPVHRQGEILIEPLYPRLRLLGGSPSTTEGKVSKLAALAAARRKREADKASEGLSKQQSSSVALLDKLNTNSKAEAEKNPKLTTASESKSDGSRVNDENHLPCLTTRKYPLRRRESPGPPSEIPQEPPKETESEAQQVQDTITLLANPSMFAKTVLGYQAKEPPLGTLHADFTLPYITDSNFTKTIAFTGPSPDDIVSNVQAKGAAYAGKAALRS